MADIITNFFEFIMNGKTAGIPNIMIIILIGAFLFIVYLLITRKSKIKEFRPLDMKKETKRRLKKDYKYFGMSLNRNIYDANTEDDTNARPLAYAIGYMKIVEMKEMKRLEPIYSNFAKELLDIKHEKTSQEIYNKPYSQLNETEKKNIDEVSKDELRNEKVETMPQSENIKFVRGKKEIKYSTPIPMFVFKICSPAIVSKLFARILGIGIDWFLLNKDQVIFESTKILITANFQRRIPFDIFTFSQAGKNLVEDISFGVERENIWQETANQIPRAVHFDTEASKALIYRREDAKIEKEKHKAQTESREFG
jgi:hypothetical protein